MTDGILSIQSAVAYGHVGNSAAVFPLQRLGFEVWPVNTVLFSNHTGYGVWRGHVVGLDQVAEILDGVRERGAFGQCRAVVSGYLGTPDLGDLVVHTVASIRELRPDLVWACDPVMGDEGRGFFVKSGIPEFFKARALTAADIVTPNQFELAYLADTPIVDIASAVAAAQRVRAKGPRIVVCTSLTAGVAAGELAVLADTADGSWLVHTPRLDIELNGTGDAFTALFLGNWLRTGIVAQALEAAVASMYALVEATKRSGERELQLVAMQDVLVEPSRRFAVDRIG